MVPQIQWKVLLLKAIFYRQPLDGLSSEGATFVQVVRGAQFKNHTLLYFIVFYC